MTEIKELRKRMNLSQTVFGERLGITRQHVYYMERGERIPSKTLMLLLNYIDNEDEKGKGGNENGSSQEG